MDMKESDKEHRPIKEQSKDHMFNVRLEKHNLNRTFNKTNRILIHRLGNKTVIFIHTISTAYDPACRL